MTHDDLLMLVTGGTNHTMAEEHLLYRKALSAVVELHKPFGEHCKVCNDTNADGRSILILYPCPTIQKIMDELK